jgi:pilus assembly protein CpaD
MRTNTLLRCVALVSVLAAGSCQAPFEDEPPVRVADGDVNYPITVEPSYQSLKVAFAGDLTPDDANRFNAFVQDYLERGNGAITVSVPSGPHSTETIRYFGEQLAALGVPRVRILVGIHDRVGEDDRTEIGFVSYTTHTDSCSNWTENVGETLDNGPQQNFGCAVQHNIAAMVADPRDFVKPRPMSASDAQRRTAVMNNYQQGLPTAAQQTAQQSGAVSDVAKQ